MLRVAVIGAGSMGRNHARVLRTTKDVEIVAIVDPEVERAKELVRIYGGKAFGCVDDALMNAVDAAVVAVPTHLHYQVAAPLLRAGVHLLVEKPLASTVEEAEALRRLAEQNRCVLAVGHIERFNPAVRLLAERLAEGRIGRVFEVRARRLGPFPVRIRDVGVVLDLATHDLDIFRFLLRSEVMRVFAEGLGALCTQREDSVTALLRFESGAIGVIEASWITPTKVRELIVVGEGGMFRVDYLTQDLFFFENAEAAPIGWVEMSVFRGVSEGAMTRLLVHKVEPLRAEMDGFLKAVRTGVDDQIVPAEDGIAALRLAWAIIEAMQRGEAVMLRPPSQK